MSDDDDPEDELGKNLPTLPFDWATEEWVLAGDALRETVEFYLAAGDGDRAKAARDALDSIKRRLDRLELYARAPRWEYAVWYEVSDSDPELLDLMQPNIADNNNSDLIFHGFWWGLSQAYDFSNRPTDPTEERWHENSAFQDWIAGDFEFRSFARLKESGLKSMTVEGFARGVCFNRSGLPTTNTFKDAPFEQAPKRDRSEGRNRLPDSALRAWWEGLPPETKGQPIDAVLTPLCRSSFPEHSIARDRIRALVPGRKPGPKPISRKQSA